MAISIRTLSLVLLSSLCSNAHAWQTGGQTGPPTLGNPTYSLTLMTADGPYTTMGYGDFDRDGQNDAALLAGSRLDILYAPGIYEALVDDVANPTQAGKRTEDFVVLRGDDHDAIVALDEDDGLVLLSFNQPTLAPARTVIGGFAGVVEMDVWGSAPGPYWIAGITADGSYVHTATAADVTSVALGTPYPTNETVVGINGFVLFDHDGDSMTPPQAASTSNAGFARFDPWGTEAVSVATSPTITYQGLTRVRRTSEPDALGMLLTVTGNPAFILWQAGQTSNYRLLPADLQIDHITAGRRDTDGYDDIMLAGRGSEQIYPMYDLAGGNGPAVFIFDAALGIKYEGAEGDAAAQESDVLMIDIDNDGDQDLLYALQNQNVLRVMRTSVVNAADFAVEFDVDNFGPGVGGRWSMDDRTMEIGFTYPSVTSSTYFEVIAWSVNLGGVMLNPQPIHSERFAVDSSTPKTCDVTLDISGAYSVGGAWTRRVYVMIQRVEAPSLTEPQTFCWPALGLILVPPGDPYSPPHPPTITFEVMPVSASGLPVGNTPGNDVDCFPSGTPPQRR